MKTRIQGAVCGLLGIGAVTAGVLSAAGALKRLPPPDEGKVFVALIRYYGLRDEILLAFLGVALLLAAAAFLLSPRRRWVAIAEEQAPGMTSEKADAEDTASPSEDKPGEISHTPAEPRLVCYLRTRLMGSVFCNSDGSSRQRALGQINAGDILICRSPGERSTADTDAETVGVFTVSGCCLGFLDAAFLRSLRSRYPGCRIGVEVERVCGGGKLPYICDLKVAVYRV